MGIKDWFKNKKVTDKELQELERAEINEADKDIQSNMKGGNSMEDDEIVSLSDEDNVDDETLEEEEEQTPKQKKPLKAVANQKKQSSQAQTLRYAAFHQAQADGIIDTLEGKPVAVDIWDMLSIIKNDLEELKRGLLG